jgi:hypothetical protein
MSGQTRINLPDDSAGMCHLDDTTGRIDELLRLSIARLERLPQKGAVSRATQRYMHFCASLPTPTPLSTISTSNRPLAAQRCPQLLLSNRPTSRNYIAMESSPHGSNTYFSRLVPSLNLQLGAVPSFLISQGLFIPSSVGAGFYHPFSSNT